MIRWLQALLVIAAAPVLLLILLPVLAWALVYALRQPPYEPLERLPYRYREPIWRVEHTLGQASFRRRSAALGRADHIASENRSIWLYQGDRLIEHRRGRRWFVRAGRTAS